MKHFDVVKRALTWLGDGRRVAVATVVKVEGSAYRREGAKMLVSEDGGHYGTISGGCLEGDVAGHAARVFETGNPKTVRYDLTEDGMWGLGLGCGGNIEVHIEFAEAAWFTQVNEALTLRRPVLAATLIGESQSVEDEEGGRITADGRSRPDVGHLLISDGKVLCGAMPDDVLTGRLLEEAPRHLQSEFSGLRSYRAAGVEWTVFVDAVLPSRRLLVFGAGHDALPVVRIAAEADLLPIVFDPRRTFLTKDRLPGAAELVLGEPSETIPHFEMDERDAAVVMHHHLERDQAALRALLEADVGYIGVLGPRARTQTLLDQMKDDGYEPTREALKRVHSPVGLDVGAETSGQIAVSIIGEVLAHHAGRKGTSLRERGGPIHLTPESETSQLSPQLYGAHASRAVSCG